MISSLIQSILAESFPRFAYWLYYSEMSIALLFAIFGILNFMPESTVAFFYAAFCFLGAKNYQRKRAMKDGKEWSPNPLFRPIFFALEICMGLIGVGVFVFSFSVHTVGSTAFWFVIAIGATLAIGAVFSIRTLARGGWPDWP